MVRAADHFEIPAMSEAVIDVFIDRVESDDKGSSAHYVIAPTEDFKETYPLQMAAGLVDANASPTCKLKLLNPLPNSAFIHQDAVLGLAERIHIIKGEVKQEETPAETYKSQASRRMTQGMSTRPVSSPETQEKNHTDMGTENTTEHLRRAVLHSRSVKNSPRRVPRTYARVKKKANKMNISLQLDKKSSEELVYHKTLRSYEGINPPGWIQAARRKAACS